MTDDGGVDYTLPEGALGEASPTLPPQPTPPSAPAASGEVPPAAPVENRVPYTRFQEVVSARQQAERAMAEARAEAEILKRQIAALTGVQQASQEDPQEAAIKAALFKVLPQLKHLEHLPFDRLSEVLDTVPQLQAAAQARYDELADATVSTLYQQAKETFGGADLNDGQRSFLHSAFVRWMETDPANLQRYMRRDGAVVNDFLKHFAATMLDPVRRQAAVTVGARATRAAIVPTGGSAGGPVGTAPPTIPAGDDEARHEAAWQAFRAKTGG